MAADSAGAVSRCLMAEPTAASEKTRCHVIPRTTSRRTCGVSMTARARNFLTQPTLARTFDSFKVLETDAYAASRPSCLSSGKAVALTVSRGYRPTKRWLSKPIPSRGQHSEASSKTHLPLPLGSIEAANLVEKRTGVRGTFSSAAHL
uniref:Uncharacterized protein n=1 Tax=Peronospora matthiolae TaxID=2874970 RepID=A0AAV1UQS2_9STRA